MPGFNVLKIFEEKNDRNQNWQGEDIEENITCIIRNYQETSNPTPEESKIMLSSSSIFPLPTLRYYSFHSGNQSNNKSEHGDLSEYKIDTCQHIPICYKKMSDAPHPNDYTRSNMLSNLPSEHQNGPVTLQDDRITFLFLCPNYVVQP